MLLLLSVVPDLAWACLWGLEHGISEQMVALCAHVEQNHSVEYALALVLEEHRFAVSAARAAEVVCSTQRRVLHEVIHNARLFLGDGHEIVAVDERLSRLLLVVAVATCVQQHMVGSIHLGYSKLLHSAQKWSEDMLRHDTWLSSTKKRSEDAGYIRHSKGGCGGERG